MLKLRSHGTNDYSVLEGGRRIGRIRFVIEGMPGVWLWAVTVPLSGGLPTGSAPDFNAAKAEFKAAWKALKASTTPEQLAAAYKASGTTADSHSRARPRAVRKMPVLRTVTLSRCEKR
jgi:hypothetical protein